MNKTALTLLALSVLVPASAAWAQPACPKQPSKLALRFTAAAPETDPLRLLDRAGRPFEFGRSFAPALSRPTWIHDRGGPTNIALFTDLRLEGACSTAQLVGPKLARLEDGVCYGVIEATVKPTCWSLQVVSDPYGYPFQVQVGTESPLPVRLEGEERWNVVRDLPRGQAANVHILALDTRKPLLTIKVSYDRLTNRSNVWKLSEKELKACVVLPDEPTGGLREGGLQDEILLARKARWWETSKVLRELAVDLAAVESSP